MRSHRKLLNRITKLIGAASGPTGQGLGKTPRGFLALTLLLLLVGTIGAQQVKPLVREIYVPFDNLNVLIDNKLQRVFMSRAEYEALLKKAEPAARRRVPFSASILAAKYAGQISNGRVLIDGQLTVDILKPGLHAVPLQLSGVGVLEAVLDNKAAPLSRGRGNVVQLFVTGVGRHQLKLKLVSPLTVSAALQSMSFQLPSGPASQLELVVPGNVEVKSGAQVVRRTVNQQKNATTFDFLLKRGPVAIVMSLNNHLLQQQQVVVARSFLVDDLSLADETLRANVTLDVLHGATRQAAIDVPNDFSINKVLSPQMSRWEVKPRAGGKQLIVHFREALTTQANIAIEAHRTPPKLQNWSMPQLQPKNVAGHVAVVGVVAERRLSAGEFQVTGLLPIDTTRIRSSIPDRKRSRAVVAYYAPNALKFQLEGSFQRPPTKLSVRSSTLLVVDDQQHKAMGSISASAAGEKLFAVDFVAPKNWVVTQVTQENGQPIPFDRVLQNNGESKIHVRLAKSVAPGSQATILFYAESTPQGWLSQWQEKTMAFPKFPVAGTANIQGAVAVQILGDMEMRPENAQELVPLEEGDRKKYGLATDSVAAAFQFSRPDFQLSLRFVRKVSSMSAESYGFFRIERGKVISHIELAYDIRRAKSRKLTFQLPDSTPSNIAIRGIRGATVKETSHTDKDGLREWVVQLADARIGRVHLVVGFEEKIDINPSAELKLPKISANAVRFQTGMVAVEGHPDFDVEVATKARRVDIGELVAAEYIPGRYLLGAFRLVDANDAIQLKVNRRVEFPLPKAIIQNASLDTLVAVNGQMVTQAKYRIRTNAQFIEARLPTDSKLWSVTLDGRPLTPQSTGNALILGLSSRTNSGARQLKVVYQSSGERIAPWGRLQIPALKIATRTSAGKTELVPIADVHWRVLLPKGLRVLSTNGNVRRTKVVRREMPIVKVAGAIHVLAGGRYGSEDMGAGWASYPLLMGRSDNVAQSVQPAKKSKQRAVTARDRAGGGGRGPSSSSRPPMTAATPKFSPFADSRKKSDKSRKPSRPRIPKLVAGDRGGGRRGNFGGLGGGAGGGAMGGQRGDTASQPGGVGGFKLEANSQAGARGGARPGNGKPRTGRNTGNGDSSLANDPRDKAESKNDDVKTVESGLLETPYEATAGFSPDDWTLEGVRSLNMDLGRILDRSDRVVAFNSLGESPQLDVTVADETRLTYFAWVVALVIGFIGVLLTRQSVRLKTSYVGLVLVAAAVLPLITGLVDEAGNIFDFAFFAGSLLIVYYVGASLCCSSWQVMRGCCGLGTSAAGILILVCLISHSSTALAQKRKVQTKLPVKIPQDAVIIPYDPSKGLENITKANRILVPYAKYVELQRLADPDKAATLVPPVVPFAFADSHYSVTLLDAEHVVMKGQVQLDVFSTGRVLVPLRLAGGVLIQAQLDGKSAQIRLAGTTNKANPNMIVMLVNKKGRHKLDLSIRFGLNKQGGWRQLKGRVPTGVASKLTMRVPSADTDVRLVGIYDRQHHQTRQANQELTTSLGSGNFGLQWRPKVTMGEVDQSLSVNSMALVDVRDDGVRVIWQASLAYRRGRRGSFTVLVPGDYLVEDVTGTNIRGWRARPRAAQAGNDPQQIDVTLLNAVTNGASFYVHLAKRGSVGTEIQQFSVPSVRVQDAVLHRGRLVVRRSPLIKLRSLESTGVNRTGNVSAKSLEGQSKGWAKSPSGIQHFQTLQFAAEQFRQRYSAQPVANTSVANLQTILRVADTRTDFESRVLLRGHSRPIHQVSIRFPTDLEVTQVLPEGLEWSIEESFTYRQLTVRMPTGQRGQFSLGIIGHLPTGATAGQLEVPRVVVEDVRDQQTQVVIQGDPNLRVSTIELQNCERIFANQVRTWLTAGQARLARLVLRCNSDQYRASLRLVTNRIPKISCLSITNVHVTDRATIEETILLSFTISNAGARRIQFTLPAALRNATIRAQKVRRTVLTATGQQADSPVQVTLELQEDVMGQFRVVVENDRLLTLTSHDVSIPKILTSTENEQYLTMQYQGRDEMEETATGFEVLNRQQLRWQRLASRFPRILKGNISKVFVARRDATELALRFQGKPRPELKTAGARIGLATTTLVIDPNGAYRASQVFQLNNRTEQYLEVELPDKAKLWSVMVNGMPVRATASSKSINHVRLPLVKTAIGAQDYPVRITYGGKLGVGWYSSNVKFPTARTVNINVELSRLRLFLPETHKWFNFDGAERQKTQDEYQARELMYLNSQVERASQALGSKNEFDQARARATLKVLQSEASRVRRKIGRQFRAGTKWAENDSYLSRNLAKAIKQRDTQSKVKSSPVFGNRGRFNSLLEEQKTKRSRNIVQGVDNNFDFSKNKSGQKGKPTGKTPMQQLQQQFQQRKGDEKDDKKGITTLRSSQKELAQTYQKRIEQRQGRRRDNRSPQKQTPTTGLPQEDVTAQQGQGQGQGQAGSSGGSSAAWGLGQGGESRMVSLDVRIPERGTEILFISPRGDLQLTSSALRSDIVSRLNRLGILALVGLAAAIGFAGRRPLKRVATSRLGIVLISLIGIGCMVTSVYPVAGLVLAITAIVLGVHRLRQ